MPFARLQFIMDVSGSMYRFNSRDKRLERMLEAALLVRQTPFTLLYSYLPVMYFSVFYYFLRDVYRRS